MKFKAEMDIEVADHDADIMMTFPNAIMDRFMGTAIKIKNLIVIQKEEEQDAESDSRPADRVNEKAPVQDEVRGDS